MKVNKPEVSLPPKSTQEIPPDLDALLKAYADVFPDDLPKGLPPSRPYDYRIVLVKDSVPPRHCLHRVTFTQKAELKRQIDELFAAGNIERAQSPFVDGVLFVEKHDKALCLCVDYRRLNAITIKDVYPTPRVDTAIDSVKDSRFFFRRMV